MNKRMYVLPLLFSLALSGAMAQEERYDDYFEASLQGKKAEQFVNEKVSIKKVGAVRSAVWASWIKANQTLEEEKLIPLTDISEGSNGTFHIPETLEPNAVMPYYYGSKGDRACEGYSFFLYLHGSGPKSHEWANGLRFAQTFDDAPCIYFVPQIPNEGIYYRWYQKSKQYVWEKLFRQILLREDVDPNKLYLFGISEGGYGSQRLASFYADYLAAAGPMAGGEPLKNAPVENCRNIGFSLRTGDKDFGFYRDILTRYTHEAFDSLEVLHPGQYRHFIELIPGRGHSIDYRPTTPWLKTNIRNAHPQHFSWEDFDMDGLRRKGFYNIEVVERVHDTLRTRYDVDIENNVVQVAVKDVHYKTTQVDPRWGIEMKFDRSYTTTEKGKFILYFDENLVDLKKKVTIVVNGKEVFKGKLKCDEENMLRSVTTFYDPERIYPASVMIDLATCGK